MEQPSTSQEIEAIQRPTGVVVAGWILLVTGAVVLVSVPIRLASPEYRRFLENLGQSWILALGFSLLAATVYLVTGATILRGHNWGRLLYLWFAPAALLVQWIFYGAQTDFCSYAPAVAVYVAIFVLLTRPESQSWFGAHAHPHEHHSEFPARYRTAVAVAGAALTTAATLIWGIGLSAYEAGNYAQAFGEAFKGSFGKFVLPALLSAPVYGLALGLWFARRPPSVLATPFYGAAAAVLNHTVIFVILLIAGIPPGGYRGEAGVAMLLPFIGVFLGATAAPLWIGAAFLLRSLARRMNIRYRREIT